MRINADAGACANLHLTVAHIDEIIRLAGPAQVAAQRVLPLAHQFGVLPEQVERILDVHLATWRGEGSAA